MFRPTTFRHINVLPILRRTYASAPTPRNPSPGSVSPVPNSQTPTPDHGSSDVGPHKPTHPSELGGSTAHAVEKPHRLDVQSDSAKRGMEEHAKAERDAGARAEQSGGGGEKVSWDEEFPNKPKGPVIGLQDERGGVANMSGRTGLSPGEGRKDVADEVESDT